MVISQGDVWWADLPVPTGSEPGYRRPVVVVQCDAFNRTNITTVLCIPLTSNLRWSTAPGNVVVPAEDSGLPRDSVANVSQMSAYDRAALTDRVGHLRRARMASILSGIDLVLGR